MGPYFKVGLIRQGLTYDLPKYSPTEFMTDVYCFQGVRSPNVVEHQELGYSRSWLHHKGCNRHHYEYQVDVDKRHGWVSLKMLLRFVLEMVCDRITASKMYSERDYTDAVPLDYYLSKQEGRFLRPETRAFPKKFLYMPRDKEERYAFGHMCWPRRHPALYERREQPVCQ